MMARLVSELNSTSHQYGKVFTGFLQYFSQSPSTSFSLCLDVVLALFLHTYGNSAFQWKICHVQSRSWLHDLHKKAQLTQREARDSLGI